MPIKKKILVAALLVGTFVGFGSGIAHVKMMHGHCQRNRAEAWGSHMSPCGRGDARWNHSGPRWHDGQRQGLDNQWGANGAPPPANQ